MKKQGLGTQLRHLIELLDGAVEQAYRDAGLPFRPRYTPVLRALLQLEPSTIGQIAENAGITQPAATQTVALMIKEGLLSAEPGPDDARQRMIRLTDKGRELVPSIQACWRATQMAADSLDEELPFPLSELLEHARAALAAKPFGQRIAKARAESK
ncbi:MAG TPA: MarR family transcriptional regulator [Paucimonas sp.]|nr:MarR family transcriptional regulator [Paucimonas sp.]